MDEVPKKGVPVSSAIVIMSSASILSALICFHISMAGFNRLNDAEDMRYRALKMFYVGGCVETPFDDIGHVTRITDDSKMSVWFEGGNHRNVDVLELKKVECPSQKEVGNG